MRTRAGRTRRLHVQLIAGTAAYQPVTAALSSFERAADARGVTGRSATAEAGGASGHTSSTNWSRPYSRPACTASIARTTCCLGGLSGSAEPAARTSSGPSTCMSTVRAYAGGSDIDDRPSQSSPRTGQKSMRWRCPADPTTDPTPLAQSIRQYALTKGQPVSGEWNT